MKKLIDKFFVEKTDSLLMQFIRYFFVGGIAAVVNIGMLFVFADIVNINYLISNIMAFICGHIVNFLLSFPGGIYDTSFFFSCQVFQKKINKYFFATFIFLNIIHITTNFVNTFYNLI